MRPTPHPTTGLPPTGQGLPKGFHPRRGGLLTLLLLIASGLLVANLGIALRSNGLHEELIQLKARMAEAQAQQQQLLEDLDAVQQALARVHARLLERAERLARHAGDLEGPPLGGTHESLQGATGATIP